VTLGAIETRADAVRAAEALGNRVLLVQFVFNTALGEVLLFRGLLLPRMGAFGRADWVANGLLFACYHLHEP
jgi:membrane protease YdiL (CAAX protease family)